MKQYLALLRHILENGETRQDRTGEGTVGLFGLQTRYDLREGFPLVTTKRVAWRSVLQELAWFLRGETSTRTLGNGIWDAWAGPGGACGPIYGHQWRSWGGRYTAKSGAPVRAAGNGYDQIGALVKSLIANPFSRRHIVSSWNAAEIGDMALPPCHMLFQCYVASGSMLDLKLTQRSADMALGVPFNVASYAVLMHILAGVCGLTPRFLIHDIGDAHIYLHHIDGIKEQLLREPLALPRLSINDPHEALAGDMSSVRLDGYESHGAIKFKIAV